MKEKPHIILSIFVAAIFIVGFYMIEEPSFFYGFSISIMNAVLYSGFYMMYKNRAPVYQSQALTVVITTTAIRFMIVGTLLILGFGRFKLVAEPLLLGFVLGQLVFFINQLTVATKNGK